MPEARHRPWNTSWLHYAKRGEFYREAPKKRQRNEARRVITAVDAPTADEHTPTTKPQG